MTADAVGVAMKVVCIGRYGGIDKVVLDIVHVHLVDPGHRIDDVERVLQCAFIVLKHRMIKGSLNNGTDVIAILPDHRIQVFLIDGSEDEAEGNEEKKGGGQDDKNHAAINRGTEFQILPGNGLACDIVVL